MITFDSAKALILSGKIAIVYFDAAKGSVEIFRYEDGWGASVRGFSNEQYLKVIHLARSFEWRPIGNSKFKAGHDMFSRVFTQFITAISQLTGDAHPVLSFDERY